MISLVYAESKKQDWKRERADRMRVTRCWRGGVGELLFHGLYLQLVAT